jgi:DNA-binding NtrC family response regulator
MASARVLVVDDEVGMLEVCADTLARLDGVEVVTLSSSREAARRLEAESFDLLVADIRMPEMDGVDRLHLAREHDATLAVLMITAFPSVETAVQCMKLGAADYVTKPFIPEDLLSAVQRLLGEKRLKDENRLLTRHVERAYGFDKMVGQSSAMQEVFESIRRIAETDTDVLILGETGTGKELVARSIHRRSARSRGRFVPVDCGAIPEDLLESELFGHERGAFTGAHQRSLGLLEFADGGSFFLDEVGELPARLQAKLLRTLQERRIRRVGGTREIEIDVRIIAATARDLDAEARAERFRSDLYYRINVARIALPPLRERAGDISTLATHFVERYAREMGREGVDLTEEALEVLARYPWPGNVRELQNILKRTLALERSERLDVEALPDEIVVHATERPAAGRGGFFALRDRRVAAFEEEYLARLMQECSGDVSRAAHEAGLPRGTLYRLLKKSGLKPDDFRS